MSNTTTKTPAPNLPYAVFWGWAAETAEHFATFEEALEDYRSRISADHPRHWVCKLENPSRIDLGCEDGLTDDEAAQVEALHDRLTDWDRSMPSFEQCFEMLSKESAGVAPEELGDLVTGSDDDGDWQNLWGGA